MMRTIVTVSRVMTGIAFAVLMMAVLIQVVGRSTSSFSPVWTEELTRFALLFVAAFGAGLSYRSGDLVNVDLICESLPAPWPRRFRLLAAAATCALSACLIVPAWRFTSIGAMQTSPALSWRMDIIHASVLVMLVSLFVFSGLRFVSMLSGRDDGLPMSQLEDAS